MNIEIKISKKPVDYESAINFLERRVEKVFNKEAPELIWILEHSNVYTCGTSGKTEELLNQNKFPIFKTSRGGKWTYHGSGQKIVYFVLNLNNREKKIKKLINDIEKWIISILNNYQIKAKNDKKNIGIWIRVKDQDFKIAAIGIKVKKWIAFHGFALNINVDKNNYKGIIPCGINDKGIINFCELRNIPKEDSFNKIIVKKFKEIFIN
tara:strand:+ start:200 stop:826 length:627 start_codon:yes stop_codon:yes gene_type:complete